MTKGQMDGDEVGGGGGGGVTQPSVPYGLLVTPGCTHSVPPALWVYLSDSYPPPLVPPAV